MDHIAIDLGGKESEICRRADDGRIIEQIRKPTARLASYLKRQPPSRVILETSAEAFKIADAAIELGHDVRVVPATLAPSLGIGNRGIKTDRRDAQVLSEVSTRIALPSVHLPSPTSRSRKSACTAREALVTSRTQLINMVRGWLRTQLIKLPSGDSTSFPRRVRSKILDEAEGLPEFIEQALRVLDVLNHVRWVLTQAAWSLRRARKLDPLSLWAQSVEARRGKRIATVALARRLAGVLYAIWRDGTRYEPSRLRLPTKTQN